MNKTEFGKIMRDLQANTNPGNLSREDIKSRMERFRLRYLEQRKERVEKMVSWFLDQAGVRFFPDAGELAEAFEATRPAEQYKGTYSCTLCYDEGKISVDWLVTWNGQSKSRRQLTGDETAELWKKHRETPGGIFRTGKQMIYSGLAECPCKRQPRPAPPIKESV